MLMRYWDRGDDMIDFASERFSRGRKKEKSEILDEEEESEEGKEGVL